MARMNVISAIAPAWQHMQLILFSPFTLRKWMGLGFVMMLGGATGGLGIPNGPDPGAGDDQIPGVPQMMEWIGQNMWVVLLGAVGLVGLVLLAMWISSVMQLVYIDQVSHNHCAIKEPYARLKELGTSYFLWLLGFGLASLFLIVTVVVLPLFGAITSDGMSVLKGLGITWGVVAGSVLVVASLFIIWVGQMFVPVAMYSRGIRVMAAWKAIIPVIKQNPGQMLLLAFLMLVFHIAEAILFTVVLIAALLVFALPGGILILLGMLIYRLVGPASSLLLLGLAAVLLPALVLAWLYAVNCAMQPVAVFIRAYSMVVLGQAEPALATISAGKPKEIAPGEG